MFRMVLTVKQAMTTVLYRTKFLRTNGNKFRKLRIPITPAHLCRLHAQFVLILETT